jgi:hypothetical protein
MPPDGSLAGSRISVGPARLGFFGFFSLVLETVLWLIF